MKLQSPFMISSRLAPAVKIADAVLSFDRGTFVIDFSDGSEHRITHFNFPRCRIRGDTYESVLQAGFVAILSFLSACAESRDYAERTGRTGENADLFPERVGAWAQQNSDEITCLSLELEESRGLITS